MINRDLWKNQSFQNINRYPCPHCNTGTLIGVNKPIIEITNSGKEYEKYNFPDGISHLFSGVLKCSNDNCKDVVAVIGEYLKDIENYDLDDINEYIENNFNLFKPKFFYPNLKLFPIIKEIPSNIKDLINEAFALYFSDYSACANKIRTTIEAILDDLNIDRTYTNSKNEKVSILSLHKRIEIYEKENPDLAKLLMAMKIIGNEGSHSTTTSIDNLLDAFEILEHFIENVYSKNSERIKELADKIVEKK